MSFTRICDHCKQVIMNKEEYLHIEYQAREDGISSKYLSRDYHLDCFNYKFSTDIRKIEEG